MNKMNPNLGTLNTEPISTICLDVRYPLQTDVNNNNDHDVWNDIIHRPRCTTDLSTTAASVQKEEPRKKAPFESSGSIPFLQHDTAADTYSTATTTTNINQRHSLSFYPTVKDLPVDISVDEIFQQTNIVTYHRPRPPRPESPIVAFQHDSTVDYSKDEEVDDECGMKSHPGDEEDEDDHNRDYFYSNDFHPGYSSHDCTEEDDEEEDAYQYHTNPLRQEQDHRRFYGNDHDGTDIDGNDWEEYAGNVPQHLSSPQGYQYRQHRSRNHSEESNDLVSTTTPSRDMLRDMHPRFHHQIAHGEIIPVSIPELDETSGHSSSCHTDATITPVHESHMYDNVYNDDDDNHRISSSIGINHQRIPTIEISPGKYLPLRGAKETMYAIQCGFYVTIPCTICTQSLICIANCEMVLCPTCRIVSPNTTMTLKHSVSNATTNSTATTGTTRNFINIHDGDHDVNDDDEDIVVRLDIKSGVGLGLQATS